LSKYFVEQLAVLNLHSFLGPLRPALILVHVTDPWEDTAAAKI